ncbi:MAG: hypothetical protein RL297_763 [Pseudomonadota bacterium]|jgi:hypothetical protein
MNLINTSRSWSSPLVLIEGWQPNTKVLRHPHGMGQRLSRWFSAPQNNKSGDTRLVLSGRIKDVCDELERLAALEDKH